MVGPLEVLADKGWHGLSGYLPNYGLHAQAVKLPNEVAHYIAPFGGRGQFIGNMFGSSDIVFKIPIAYHGQDFFYVQGVPNNQNHDSVSVPGVVGSPVDGGLIRVFDVLWKVKSPNKVINEEKTEQRLFGLRQVIVKGTRIIPGDVTYFPAHADASGFLVAEGDGERLYGMNFEFQDKRWERGLASNQYSVVLRESDFQLLREAAQYDPSIMLELCFKVFPNYHHAQGEKPFAAPKRYFMIRTLEEMSILREQMKDIVRSSS